VERYRSFREIREWILRKRKFYEKGKDFALLKIPMKRIFTSKSIQQSKSQCKLTKTSRTISFIAYGCSISRMAFPISNQKDYEGLGDGFADCWLVTLSESGKQTRETNSSDWMPIVAESWSKEEDSYAESIWLWRKARRSKKSSEKRSTTKLIRWK